MFISKAFLTGFRASGSPTTLFIVIFAAFASCAGNSLSATATGTAPSVVPPLPTHTPTPLPNIWQPVASVNYGKAIAFAPSDPQTGYVCGTPGISKSTLELGVTHDGGFTWTTHSLAGITGASCRIAVNPYNMNDLVVSALSSTCFNGCVPPDYTLYRSFDGGKTWTHLVTPSGNEASGYIYLSTPVWTPTALFFFATPVGGSNDLPTHPIAVSVNGGLLTWTTAPAPPMSNPVIQIFTIDNSINAVDISDAPGGKIRWDLATSTNNGATWTHVTPQGEVPNDYIQPDSDGQELVGHNANGDYVRSSDGGKTWDRLPAIQSPTTYFLFPGAQVTPDRTIFGLSGNTKTGLSIDKLKPGATSWELVAALPASSTILSQNLYAVSWDTNGHPKLVWTVITQGSYPNELPVLEYHPA